MLHITIPARELWDEEKAEFLYTRPYSLQLEHSLVSISKWESKWCKPFLSKADKTREETIDYIKCMTLTQNVSPEVYQYLTEDNINQIERYIKASMTATFFSDDNLTKGRQRIITSELIYYWMVALNIPFKCEKWHLNRLLTLIRVCNAENTPPKKRNANELKSRNRALNAARRNRLNSKG